MKSLSMGMCAAAVCVAAIVADAWAAKPAKPAEDPKDFRGVVRSKGDPGDKVLIRPKYVPGQLQQYRLQLYGEWLWTPKHKALTWGRMKTDCRYTLATKVIRDSGACTFTVLGEYLNSAAQGPDGSIEVEASRKETAIRINGKYQANSDKGLLAKPMTITLGPLGVARYGTGLAPVAIYFLPHIDRRFWNALVVAPLKEVAPGDGWDVQFNVAVPGGTGKPLAVKARWVVQKWRSHRGRRVLPLLLEAELDLKNSNILLRNGDLAHIARGTYKAEGTALWDVDNGLLAAAEARQRIDIRADSPVIRTHRSDIRCSLDLLAAGQPTVKRR